MYLGSRYIDTVFTFSISNVFCVDDNNGFGCSVASNHHVIVTYRKHRFINYVVNTL